MISKTSHIRNFSYSTSIQADVEALQGRKLNIKADADEDTIIDQIAHNSKLFNVRIEQNQVIGYCDTVRPIIRNSLGESSCLGPQFAGIISLEQTFSELQPEIADDVPVRYPNCYLHYCRERMYLYS